MKPIYLFLISAFLVASAHAEPACCSKALAAGTPLPDKSLYHLETRWTSDFGKAVELRQLQGQVQVVTMFFASCIYACPVLVNDVKRIEAELRVAGITNVGFVLVSFDTERDTVERLHTYRASHKLNDRWLLLRGDDDAVTELAALVGVKFKKEKTGQYAHSNIITVLNQNGEVIHQQVGLNIDPGSTISAIKRSLGTPLDPQ